MPGSGFELKGDYFGKEQGGSAVVTGGLNADVLSWGQDHVRVKVPKDAKPGEVRVYVSKYCRKSEQYKYIVVDPMMVQSAYGAVLAFMITETGSDMKWMGARLVKASAADPEWQQYEVTMPDGTVSQEWATAHEEGDTRVVKSAGELRKEGPKDPVSPDV